MRRQVILTSTMLAIRMIVVAQGPEPKGVQTQGFEDVGNLKVQAELSVTQAQTKLANAYLANSRPVDARRWYESAAAQNSPEG